MLETTSFAILPSKTAKIEEKFGLMNAVTDFTWDGNALCGQLSKGVFKIYFVQPAVVRIIVATGAKIDEKPTIATIGDDGAMVADFRDDGDVLVITNGEYTVKVNKTLFSVAITKGDKVVFASCNNMANYGRDKKIRFNASKTPGTMMYGLGEKAGFLNKDGERISNWNTDVFAPHNKDTVELYQSIPFVVMHDTKRTTGVFFDNPYRTEFDMQTTVDELNITADGGQINAYIVLGDDLKEVVANYTGLTGKTPLPPKWSLGYHQSRYSYSSQDEVRQIVAKFKEHDLPIDCIFLDIHYMDDYRVFTFDEQQFPDYRELIAELNADQIDVVPIVDPGVKKDPEYAVYREGVEKGYFSKYLEGEIFIGPVWPGPSAFPDFLNGKVQKWWGDLHKFYTDLGVRGIWNDMNEPSVFNENKTMDLDVMHDLDGKLITHKEGHNLYGLYMSKATFEGLQEQLQARPFSLTRAGYAGVQRYSAVWTGDNRSHWEHLEMSLPMMMNLGLSGVAFAGADVGGFSSDATPELLIRWTQVGAFMPYFRNHSVQESIFQEPWVFGAETLASVKKYIEVRYQFMPYIYTLFAEAEKTGLPVVRPLVMEYPTDPKTFNCSDQFILGANVLVAPILRPGQTVRSVYLPAGTWYDFWSNEQYDGGQYILVDADLDTMPIFVKAGTVLPLGSAVKNTKEIQNVMLMVYPNANGTASGELYEDDDYTYAYQTGDYCLINFTYSDNEMQKCQEGNRESKMEILDVTVVK